MAIMTARAKPKERPDAERLFLEKLPHYQAVQVAGSEEKLRRVKEGESLADILNEGKDPLYHLTRVWDATLEGMVDDAYAAAKNGGPNAEWYKLQLGLPESKLRKAIRSFERQIEQHQQWIENPLTKTPDFYSLHAGRQKHLIEQNWPADIQRHKDFITILKGVLREKGYGDK